MARARNIKPSFFQNEDLAELTPLARLSFIGLWTIADYKGCLEYRPKRLKVQLLPYDECDINEIINSLEKSGLILIYSVHGQSYIKVINFEKHQNPHKNEREAGSEIPDYVDCIELFSEINELEEYGTNTEKIGTARADTLIPLTDTPIPQHNKVNDDFLIFWKTYPKKVGKDKALEAWKKRKPPLNEVLKALSWQTRSDGWSKDNGQYIPNPLTYINQGRWQDEPPINSREADRQWFVGDGETPAIEITPKGETPAIEITPKIVIGANND